MNTEPRPSESQSKHSELITPTALVELNEVSNGAPRDTQDVQQEEAASNNVFVREKKYLSGWRLYCLTLG